MKNEDYAAAAASLLPYARELIPSLLTGGKWEGHEWVCASYAGGNGDSCKVNAKSGISSDFATGESAGDLLALIKIVKKFDSMREALNWAQQNYLGDSAPIVSSFSNKQANSDWVSQVPAPEEPPEKIVHWMFASQKHDWKYTSKDGTPDMKWVYRDPDGKPLQVVCRYDKPDGGKDVFPYTYGNKKGRIGWHWKQIPSNRPLYGQDRLHLGKTVIVPEGEKAADAAYTLLEQKVPVITWSGGSKAVTKANFSVLKDKNVIVIADGDKAGHEAAKAVAIALQSIAAKIWCIYTEEHPTIKGWDAADALAESWTGQQFFDWIEKSKVRYKPLSHQEEVVPTDSCSNIPASCPKICIEDGCLALTADEAEQVLLNAECFIFQRDHQLVRPIIEESKNEEGKVFHTLKVIEIDSTYMRDILSREAHWLKYDARKKDYKRTNPPMDIGKTVLARRGEFPFPLLKGVTTIPILRKDGAIITKEGYDELTGMLLFKPVAIPKIPDSCTKEHAQEALQRLEKLLSEFPFVDGVSHAIAICILITIVIRGSLRTSPMFIINASAPGTGKSYMVDIVSMLATGDFCAVVSFGEKAEENEKRLGSALLDARPLVSIDNIEGEIGDPFLCQATERPRVAIRILGKSQLVDIENKAVICGTGNNVVLCGDINRRALLCHLDANQEDPELRKFKHDPLKLIQENRGQYVADCLTIVKAYIDAGLPNLAPKLGSYEDWSKYSRSPLMWLGYDDPVNSMLNSKQEDPERIYTRRLFQKLHEAYPGIAFLTREILQNPTPELTEALEEALSTDIKHISTRSLGRWLKKKTNGFYSPYRLRHKADEHGHSKQWRIEMSAVDAVSCGEADMPF